MIPTYEEWMTLFIFDKNEQKIRKHWLIALLCNYLVWPIASFALATFFKISAAGESPLMATAGAFTVLILVLIASLSTIFLVWALYYCAYKKHGTRFLTFWLCVSLLTWAFELYGIFLMGSLDSYGLSMFAINFPLFLWWVVASFRLRSLNKKLAKRALDCQEYLHGIELMKTAQNIEDLDTKFHALIEKWPQSEPRFSEEYKSIKAKLLNPNEPQ
jgi:ACR3 family arsenite efflux pump ArsB